MNEFYEIPSKSILEQSEAQEQIEHVIYKEVEVNNNTFEIIDLVLSTIIAALTAWITIKIAKRQDTLTKAQYDFERSQSEKEEIRYQNQMKIEAERHRNQMRIEEERHKKEMKLALYQNRLELYQRLIKLNENISYNDSSKQNDEYILSIIDNQEKWDDFLKSPIFKTPFAKIQKEMESIYSQCNFLFKSDIMEIVEFNKAIIQAYTTIEVMEVLVKAKQQPILVVNLYLVLYHELLIKEPFRTKLNIESSDLYKQTLKMLDMRVKKFSHEYEKVKESCDPIDDELIKTILDVNYSYLQTLKYKIRHLNRHYETLFQPYLNLKNIDS